MLIQCLFLDLLLLSGNKYSKFYVFLFIFLNFCQYFALFIIINSNLLINYIYFQGVYAGCFQSKPEGNVFFIWTFSFRKARYLGLFQVYPGWVFGVTPGNLPSRLTPVNPSLHPGPDPVFKNLKNA